MVPLFTFMGRDIYLFAEFSVESWTLVNLLLIVLGIFLTAKTAFRAIKMKRAANRELVAEDTLQEELFTKNLKWLGIGAMLSIIGVILFALTQYLAADIIALLDYWTIAHMALIIAQIVAFKVFRNRQAQNDIFDDKTEIIELDSEMTDIADDETVII
jgi:hypothetical protein